MTRQCTITIGGRSDGQPVEALVLKTLLKGLAEKGDGNLIFTTENRHDGLLTTGGLSSEQILKHVLRGNSKNRCYYIRAHHINCNQIRMIHSITDYCRGSGTSFKVETVSSETPFCLIFDGEQIYEFDTDGQYIGGRKPQKYLTFNTLSKMLVNTPAPDLALVLGRAIYVPELPMIVFPAEPPQPTLKEE